MKKRRSIALIADMHVGSKVALWPDGFTYKDAETEEERELNGCKGQQQLFKYWQDFGQVCDDENVDTVILDGDVLHGTNRKEFGANLMISDLEIQKKAACQLLEPLVKNRNFIALSGSGYHESLDTRVHKEIAEKLGGKFGGLLLNKEIEGTSRVMNIAHGVGGAAIYTTMILNREADFILMAEALGKIDFHVDIVVRAHLHRFIHIHLAKMHMIQCPCWMAWEPNKIYIKYFGKKQPDIGGVILNIDEKDRITVWHYLYPLPHIADKLGRL